MEKKMGKREEILSLFVLREEAVATLKSAIIAMRKAFDALVQLDAEILQGFTSLLEQIGGGAPGGGQTDDDPIDGVKVVSSAYAYGDTIEIPGHRAGDRIVVFAWGISRPGVAVAPATYQEIAYVERLSTVTASPRSLRAIQKTAQSAQEASVRIANARVLAVAVLRSASGVISVGGSSLHSGDNVLNGLPLQAIGASNKAAKILQFGGWRSTATIATDGVPGHLSTVLLARDAGEAGGAFLAEAPEMRTAALAQSTVTLSGQPQGIMSVTISFLDGVAVEEGDGDTSQPVAPPNPVTPPVTTPSPPIVIDRTVKNSTELFNAMRDAAPGSVIGLQPGQYADLPNIQSIVKSTPVRLVPVDRANPPVFGYRPFVLRDSSGFIFDGLRFRNLNFRSDGSGYLADHGRAISVRYCSNITVRRCLFEGYMEQLTASFTNHLTIEWNTFDRTQGDSIRVFEQCDDIIIRNNDMKNIRPDFGQISTFHPDYIQFAVNNPATEPANRGAHRVLIESNKMIREPFTWVPNAANPSNPVHNSNSYVQTCSWFHEKLQMSGSTTNPSPLWPAVAYRDFKVIGNDLQGSHINCLAISGTIGVEVRGNRIRTTQGTPAASLPTINLYNAGGRRNEQVTITNNVLPRSIAGSFPTDSSSTITNNVVSQTANPVGWVDPVCGHLAYPGGVTAP